MKDTTNSGYNPRVKIQRKLLFWTKHLSENETEEIANVWDNALTAI
jgi:hypothetical protein